MRDSILMTTLSLKFKNLNYYFTVIDIAHLQQFDPDLDVEMIYQTPLDERYRLFNPKWADHVLTKITQK